MNSNSTKPVFSIIIPTLNEEKHLPNLLEDLSWQSFSNFEAIIVDGRSKDKTIVRVKDFKRKLNLTILKSKKRNVSYQRNLGSKKAKAEWIVFMDADNRLPSYFLQGIKFQTERIRPDILSTRIKPDSKNKKDKAIATAINIFIDANKNSKNPYILESFLCIKKDTFEKLGKFDEKVVWHEGGDLLRKAKKKGFKFHFVKYPKYQYSFRRLRKQGSFKLAGNVAINELARISKRQVPKSAISYLYPMEGGHYFEIGKKPLNKIEKAVSKLLYSQNKNNDQKSNFLKRLFGLTKN